MKKLLACTLFALIGTSSAYAADWTCEYTGSWSGTSTGDFKWTVLWTNNGAGWTTFGEYDDKYGHAILDGSCANKSCSFTQKYTTGSMKDSTYYWTGAYTDDKTRDAETVNTFKGTWGADKKAKDGGTWSAVAMCRKVE